MSTNPSEAEHGGPESTPAPRQRLSDQASSPTPRQNNTSAAKTETPRNPEQVHHAFEDVKLDPLAIGNREYEFNLKVESRLGYFLPRASLKPEYVYIELSMLGYREGIRCTLLNALHRALRNKGYIEEQDITVRILTVANTLTQGCVIMTYLKLCTLHQLNPTQYSKFLKRPKVPEHFEVPSPFALAISQLGVVKVSSRLDDLKVAPTLSSADAANFGLETGQRWSSTIYAQAVEYAKSLGLQFSTVDRTVKLGSSWWLYEQEVDEDIFTLQCVIPEDNYTPQTAVLHTLWCDDGAGGFANEFADLTPLGNHNYGTMLRNPHPGINVSSYFAIEDANESVWKVV